MLLAIKKSWLWIVLLIYGITHIWGLVKLPVFADEAIYIRWAQLIMDDAQQYLFFPLNDGKTPLFIWQLVPWLYVFKDPLFAARFSSLVAGLLQVLLAVQLVKELKGKIIAQVIAAVLVVVLPFWFFHHRMGLMEAWLGVYVSLASWSLLKALRLKSYLWSVYAGVALGAALLTKVPAVLVVPSLLIIALYQAYISKEFVRVVKQLAVCMSISAAVFFSLKLSESFSQLFSRGSDFLYPTKDILRGKWRDTIINVPTYVSYFWQYLTFPVVLVSVWGLMLKHKVMITVLLVCFLSFVLPIAIMGKVVYPRYFFPASVFLTTAAALAFEQLLVSKSKVKIIVGLTMLAVSLLLSLRFMLSALWNPNTMPFVSADSVQYLTEWSSGHGIKETFMQLQQASRQHKVSVATEGYFGTLPDGLLMYLHNQDVSNIKVEGVGQPLSEVPTQLYEDAATYDRLWLLVNSHRRQFELPSHYLKASYCRPHQAPCLELWDVTQYVKDTQNP